MTETDAIEHRTAVTMPIRIQKPCLADCDGGIDWSSGEAKVCDECEGAGTYFVTPKAVDGETKSLSANL